VEGGAPVEHGSAVPEKIEKRFCNICIKLKNASPSSLRTPRL